MLNIISEGSSKPYIYKASDFTEIEKNDKNFNNFEGIIDLFSKHNKRIDIYELIIFFPFLVTIKFVQAFKGITNLIYISPYNFIF